MADARNSLLFEAAVHISANLHKLLLCSQENT